MYCIALRWVTKQRVYQQRITTGVGLPLFRSTTRLRAIETPRRRDTEAIKHREPGNSSAIPDWLQPQLRPSQEKRSTPDIHLLETCQGAVAIAARNFVCRISAV